MNFETDFIKKQKIIGETRTRNLVQSTTIALHLSSEINPVGLVNWP